MEDRFKEELQQEAYFIWLKDKCKTPLQCWLEAQKKVMDRVVQEINTWGDQTL